MITLRSTDEYLRVSFLTWKRSNGTRYDRPSHGHVYLSVELKLQNLSSKTYSDAPDNGSVLEDTNHYQYDTTIGGVSPSLDGNVRIVPNDYVVGWVTFEVPKTAQPRLFEFTLDSGVADNATGVWYF